MTDRNATATTLIRRDSTETITTTATHKNGYRLSYGNIFCIKMQWMAYFKYEKLQNHLLSMHVLLTVVVHN